MQPGKQLRNSVRAGFVDQGSSLAEYCKNNRICNSNANKVLLGKWNGKKAADLRFKLITAAKIEIPECDNSEDVVVRKVATNKTSVTTINPLIDKDMMS